jgi:hypothetical protein
MLAKWMKADDGWKVVHNDLFDFACEAAGCSGFVYANAKTSELVLCDGSDLVLWRIGPNKRDE